ncbi:uncharacterized protein LOC125376204 [Haliotis rufescens]|uniref:uncharacterized protein LOC125376204 n=1 Tax=Haliotis rufescens TaxID=6454 RepID=UPI00201F66B6|nr:uncharacterized protein LOC125376204 [Haliotis rufescens]
MKYGTVLTVCHVMVTMVTCQDIDDFVPQKVQKMFRVLSQSKMVDTPPRARSAGTPVGPLVALREDLDTCRADVARLKNRLKNLSTQVSSSPDAVQMPVPVEGHCPKPVAPEYGHVDYSSTIFGATANIVCDDNYTYLGQGSQITCTASGAWKSYTDETGQCYESTWTNPVITFHFLDTLPKVSCIE